MRMPTIAEVIAILLVVLLGAAMLTLFFVAIPAANKDVLVAIIGILSANVGAVVGYFYGSSAGSKGKDATIASLSASQSKPDDVA